MTAALWTVSSYYNPAGWQSRYRNVQRFRRQLETPLLIVEHAVDGRFELTPADADILIQLDGGDVMWQKERLLNIGLKHLPQACTAVAWIDADVLFAEPGWSGRAIAALEQYEVMQLFARCEHLQPDSCSPADGVLLSLPSIMAELDHTADPDAFLDDLCWHFHKLRPTEPVPITYRGYGFAWAARRSWLEAIGGLYDRCITGGGDRLIFFALQGRLEQHLAACNQSGIHREARALRRWAERLLAHRPRTGYLMETIHHLYHGQLQHRAYVNRHFLMRRHGFDYDRDLELNDQALWRFSSSCSAAFRQALLEYFAARREDG